MTSIKIIKRTKSVTTLGPATNDIEKIKQLVENGATCARLNFSHGSHEEHAKRIDMIREVAKQKHIPIAIMLDTKGPEVRTHTFKNGSVEIKIGTTVDIVDNEEILGSAEKFSVNYPNLAKDIKINDNLLVDDGKLTLKVDAIKAHTITCRALNTHTIKDRRAINIPNVKLSLDFISEKDKADLIFGCQKKVDYVAASFVCSAADIKAIRAVLDANDGKHIQIIAKIEAQLAVEHFDQILEVTDAIMVARGDLGVEIPFEQVPFLEKEWIRKCRLANKPVIVATQMLDSMITNPHPTRAEVTDVWVAVEWGATCTMLSGESANGNYPVLAVATMSKIIADAESHCNDNRGANALLKHKDKKIVDMMKIITKEKPRYLITNEQNHNFVKIIANASLSFNIIVLVDNMIDYNKFALNAGIYPFLVDKKMIITLNNSKELLVAINKSYDILPKTKIVIIDSNNKKPILLLANK